MWLIRVHKAKASGAKTKLEPKLEKLNYDYCDKNMNSERACRKLRMNMHYLKLDAI